MSRRMPGLKPVSRVTLSEQVASQIADQISQGRWQPGDRLPSESELCVTLKIGRSTLREALKSLAFVGMVQMRPGEGTYVLDSTQRLVERILAHGTLKNEKELEDVGEARLILETEIAALAAERAEPSDVERLEELLGKMEEALADGDGRAYAALDVEFHLAIAGCSKNQVFEEFLVPVRGVLQEWITKSQELPGVRQGAQSQHTIILDAIRRHDVDRARRIMRSHLQTCEKAFNLMGRISETSLTRTADAQV